MHPPPRYREAGTPYGIRTRATALKGRRPRPLDEGGQSRISPGHSQRHDAGSLDSLGYRDPNAQTRCLRLSAILIHRAPIAQLVELRTFNPQVPGSSPGGGTTTDVVTALPPSQRPLAPRRYPGGRRRAGGYAGGQLHGHQGRLDTVYNLDAATTATR
jgi:hypothetical protein